MTGALERTAGLRTAILDRKNVAAVEEADEAAVTVSAGADPGQIPERPEALERGFRVHPTLQTKRGETTVTAEQRLPLADHGTPQAPYWPSRTLSVEHATTARLQSCDTDGRG